MIGLYRVIAESVAQRVLEIGIRMALGATAAGIARMVLTRSALTVIAGIGIGLAGAVGFRGVMGKFVFGIEAGDPVSDTAACGLLAVAAFCATLIPARRAAAIDPLQALRRE
jgi:ABC-type antimicrobial peptide transport system permease subunit